MKQTVVAQPQYTLTASDLEVVLALSRGASLAGAGERLGVDASTVFRSLQRLERNLGQRLFERTRAGYLQTELAAELAGHAEEMEVALESARSSIASALVTHGPHGQNESCHLPCCQSKNASLSRFWRFGFGRNLRSEISLMTV